MIDVGRVLSRLAAWAARRPLATVAFLGVLGLGGAAAAAALRPSAASETLVGRSSDAYRATQRFYSRFGEEPVEVLVSGDLRKLLLSSDVERLVGLEGCLSGKLPPAAFAAEGGAQGPCAQLERAHTVKVVLGPGTFINEAALQIDSSLAAHRKQAETQARRAGQAVYRSALARGLGAAQAGTLAAEAQKATLAGFAAEVTAFAIRYGLTATPSLTDHGFVSTLVFEPSKPAGTPKQRFAYLFPSRHAALISVRLKAGLGEAQRSHTIALIRQAVAMSQWQPANGERYLVTGEPVIASDLVGSISHTIELLLVVVMLVMGAILSLVFSARPRLLPLGVAVLAAALTFGALAVSGASLTMASVAVLPVLVGLSVDYAIQFQSRAAQALAQGRPGGGRERVVEAVGAAAREGAPTIATAALASMAGMLVLLLSPVPMVRGFGLLLVVGIGFAFVCALLLGSAGMALLPPGPARSAGSPARRAGPAGWTGGALADAWRGARELLAENPVNRLLTRLALQRAVSSPARVLGIGLALAALGWGLDTQVPVQTDIAKLAPQGLSSLSALRTLERESGVGGEIDLMVSSRSLAQPKTIRWMASYQQNVLKRMGYSATRGCGRAQLCPAFSLPDLFSTGGEGQARLAKLTSRQVRGLLAAIPPYFSQEVISSDRRSATLAFGARLMPLAEQQRTIAQMRALLHPPAGVQAQLVGVSVLASQSAAQVASTWRRILTLLAALAAVALVLLAAFRGDARRALVPLVPVLLATGWSSLAVFLLGVPLNPMSVTLGALVVAVSTEFSVLLCERHRQELAAGDGVVQALRRAYRHTGAAVAASAVTAIAGFGVLAFAQIAMLRDFGVVTLVDLSVSLLGVWVALPAAIVLAQGRERSWAGATRATSPSLG